MVIPAFNEENRIKRTLVEALQYFHEKKVLCTQPFSYEIIVVDDGSTDRTTKVVDSFVRSEGVNTIRYFSLPFNTGKGNAVKEGVCVSRGARILYADADGATPISEIASLERVMDETSAEIVIGSRSVKSHPQPLLAKLFRLAVWLLGVRGISDSQCGFKLFTREAAAQLFPSLHLRGWAFDSELLLLAATHGLLVSEVPVEWSAMAGGRRSPSTPIAMLADLLRLRFCYLTGLWAPLHVPAYAQAQAQAQDEGAREAAPPPFSPNRRHVTASAAASPSSLPQPRAISPQPSHVPSSLAYTPPHAYPPASYSSYSSYSSFSSPKQQHYTASSSGASSHTLAASARNTATPSYLLPSTRSNNQSYLECGGKAYFGGGWSSSTGKSSYF